MISTLFLLGFYFMSNLNLLFFNVMFSTCFLLYIYFMSNLNLLCFFYIMFSTCFLQQIQLTITFMAHKTSNFSQLRLIILMYLMFLVIIASIKDIKKLRGKLLPSFRLLYLIMFVDPLISDVYFIMIRIKVCVFLPQTKHEFMFFSGLSHVYSSKKLFHIFKAKNFEDV